MSRKLYILEELEKKAVSFQNTKSSKKTMVSDEDSGSVKIVEVEILRDVARLTGLCSPFLSTDSTADKGSIAATAEVNSMVSC